MQTMPSSNSNSNALRRGLDAAIKSHRDHKSRQAAKALEQLARAHPESAPVAGMLGGIYFELDDFSKARRWFKRATELSPRSELASVGLFHSLWELGRSTEAVSEMRRFLRLSDSPEYTKVLRDLTVEGRLVPHIAHVA
jgi:predicted Zn-dependent protease